MIELLLLPYYNQHRDVHVMRLLHSAHSSDHRMEVVEASFVDPYYNTAFMAFRLAPRMANAVMTEVLYATRQPDGRGALNAADLTASAGHTEAASVYWQREAFWSPRLRAIDCGKRLKSYARRVPAAGTPGLNYHLLLAAGLAHMAPGLTMAQQVAPAAYQPGGAGEELARYARAMDATDVHISAVWHAAGVYNPHTRTGVLKYDFESLKFPRVDLDTLPQQPANHPDKISEATRIAAGIPGIRYTHAMQYIHFNQAIEVDQTSVLLDMATMFSGTTSVRDEYRRYCDTNAAPLDEVISQVTKSAQLFALTHKMSAMRTYSEEIFVRSMQHAASLQNPRQEENELMQMMRRMQVDAGAIGEWPVRGFHPDAHTPAPPPKVYTTRPELAYFHESVGRLAGYKGCLTTAPS
jgi:hypothetical protein